MQRGKREKQNQVNKCPQTGALFNVLVLKWLTAALASEYEMAVCLGPMTYLVSILVTAGVSFVVSLLVARKNKKIDMVAALKAPE